MDKDEPIMSRFLLLILINLPIILVGIISAITDYKTKRSSKRKYIAEVTLWLLIGVGLVFIEPIYNTLIRYNLTNSTPMSLFDIVLLTLVLLCLFLIKQTNEKNMQLANKVARMHENLAIVEAERLKNK
jgi:glucan phosphoethanolaminetransferase (alkaline phosphatase superfamily)